MKTRIANPIVVQFYFLSDFRGERSPKVIGFDQVDDDIKFGEKIGAGDRSGTSIRTPPLFFTA